MQGPKYVFNINTWILQTFHIDILKQINCKSFYPECAFHYSTFPQTRILGRLNVDYLLELCFLTWHKVMVNDVPGCKTLSSWKKNGIFKCMNMQYFSWCQKHARGSHEELKPNLSIMTIKTINNSLSTIGTQTTQNCMVSWSIMCFLMFWIIFLQEYTS